MSKQYLIGIDLGTTNCSVAYVDTKNAVLPVQTFLIPQLGKNGKIEHLATLPSYCYLGKEYSLPWQKNRPYSVGRLAWEEGSQVPLQLVQSAKSWLCHPYAHLKGSLLPENASPAIQRISPLEASARYLNHIREAWNFAIAKGDPEKEFESQDIVLTIPASFDETARSLTYEAARLAGFKSLVMLEEPQAAFYYWMASNEKSFDKHLADKDVVLVVDIGGGTTDFSLIQVEIKNGVFTFDRIAVGSHLLLGGDNIDAAIAHSIQEKIGEPEDSLKFAARQAKEVLLAEDAPPSYKAVIQGRGASVIRNTQFATITKEEILALIHEGFFGLYSFEDAQNGPKRQALKSEGLLFEEDPSITRHLARFLAKAGKKPNKVLFNGGTLKPNTLRLAIMKSLRAWFPESAITELKNESFDLAVAKGAAQFSKIRFCGSQRIGGGAPRAYYAEVNCDNKPQAMAILERGAEEERTYKAPYLFHLLPNTPVIFKLYASHTRTNDKLGDFADLDPLEMLPLPVLQTVLKFGQTKESIPVNLEAKFTAIGILELSLQSANTDHRWHLEFNTGNLDPEARVDETHEISSLQPAIEYLDEFFLGMKSKDNLMDELEKILQQARQLWPISVLRKFADHLLKYKTVPKQKDRYWNALGYFLRPGFGFPLDDFRMKEFWKLTLAEASEKHVQKWICYRRVAGGLGKGQQLRIAQEMIGDWKIGKFPQFKSKEEAYFFSEKMRAVASLEWIDAEKKIALGNAIVNKIAHEGCNAIDAYALGRLGARNLLYAPFTQALDKTIVESWLEKLLSINGIDGTNLECLFMQLARYSPHRHLNIKQSLIKKITSFMPDKLRLKDHLEQETILDHNEQAKLFADNLPLGLSRYS